MDYTTLAKQYGGAILNAEAPPPAPPSTSSATIPPPSAAPATNYADLAKQYSGTAAASVAQTPTQFPVEQSTSPMPQATPGAIPPAAQSTIYMQPEAPPIPDASSFASRLAEDWKSRWEKINELHQRNVAQAGQFTPPGTKELNQINELGQAAGAFTIDPLNQLLISAWNTLTPDEFKSWMKDQGNFYSKYYGKQFQDFANTASGKAFVNALSKGYEPTAKFIKANPIIGETVNSLFNFSMLPLEKLAATEAKNVVGDVARVATQGIAPESRAISQSLTSRKLSNEIRDRLQRSVEFFQPGNKTQTARTALDESTSAVKDLISNKDTFNITDMNYKQKPFKLPEDPKTAFFDTTQIIEQRKKQYGAFMDEVLDRGAQNNTTVLPDAAIAAVRDKMQSAALIGKADSAAIVEKGQKIIDNYTTNGPLQLRTAHEMLKAANAAGPFTPTFDAAVIDMENAGINAIRKEFYSKMTPEEASVFKNWGNLATFQEAIDNQVKTKLAGKGFSYPEIAAMMSGLKYAATGRASVSILATARGVQEIEQAARAAGNQLVKMFKNGAKLSEKEAELAKPFAPKSATGRAMQNAPDILGNERGAIGNLNRESLFRRRFDKVDKFTGFNYVMPDGDIFEVPGHGAVGNIPSFLKETNAIRVMKNQDYGFLSIEIHGKPTDAQIAKLRSPRMTGKVSRVSVEVYNNEGKRVLDQGFDSKSLAFTAIQKAVK